MYMTMTALQPQTGPKLNYILNLFFAHRVVDFSGDGVCISETML